MNNIPQGEISNMFKWDVKDGSILNRGTGNVLTIKGDRVVLLGQIRDDKLQKWILDNDYIISESSGLYLGCSEFDFVDYSVPFNDGSTPNCNKHLWDFSRGVLEVSSPSGFRKQCWKYHESSGFLENCGWFLGVVQFSRFCLFKPSN